MPVILSAVAPRLPATPGFDSRAVGETPKTPLNRASSLLHEGDFVRALNVFGSLLLDGMPADPASQDRAVFGAAEMNSFRSRVNAFLRDPNSRATKGEQDALRSIALAFERSRGSDPSFGPARWADFLDFVQSKMPADVQGFSHLAREVRKANLTDNDSAVFSRTDMRGISSGFQQLLAHAYQGDRFGADDWARLFLGLVVNDGGESTPAPTPAPTPNGDQKVFIAGIHGWSSAPTRDAALADPLAASREALPAPAVRNSVLDAAGGLA